MAQEMVQLASFVGKQSTGKFIACQQMACKFSVHTKTCCSCANSGARNVLVCTGLKRGASADYKGGSEGQATCDLM